MVLEATVICLDNSDWMRNGDYAPSRMEAQQDAANLICNAKTQSNPENNVALLAMAGKSVSVEVALVGSQDLGKLLAALTSIKLGGKINFPSALQVGQLVLKHRQNKNQKSRLIVFVGSPIDSEQQELVNLGKKLKKNNVAVDVVNFGEEDVNVEKLEAFVAAVNSNDNSHLVNVPPGPHMLADVLLSSPIVMEEGAVPPGVGGSGGGDFEFGVDPSVDPELAMVLRMSMEEERRRQERLAQEQTGASTQTTTTTPGQGTTTQQTAKADKDVEMTDEDALLKQALAMSMGSGGGDTEMSEDQALALAIQMSMQAEQQQQQQGTDQMAQDTNFLQSVLGALPDVNPNQKKDEEKKKE